MMPLLDVENLSVSLRHGRHLVDGISLRLERGQRLGVVGRSGSGKSLMIHAIAGLLPEELVPTGSVRLDGKEILDLQEKDRAKLRGRRIGTIFQEPMTALDPVRRIGDQIRAPMDNHRLGTGCERVEKVLDLMQAVGLPPSTFSPDLFPHELSGGQRQRVVLAAALAADPDLLLADEPTTALDVVIQRQILDLLDRLVETRGLTLVLVSHDLGVISRLCENVLIMDAGKAVGAGSLQDMLSKPSYLATIRPARGQPAISDLPADPAPPNLAVMRNVSRQYRLPDRSWRSALAGIDLAVGEGEAVGLVGSSGSGKSTLARLLTGLELPDSGRILLDGHDPSQEKNVRHSVQMVFQDPFDSLDPRWTVGRIVGEPLERDHLPAAERSARVAQALEEVDLPAGAELRHPHAFSGGQRQRIAIARALVARPRLVVLDEPLSALDVVVQDQVIDLLIRLQQRHRLAYLLISHDLSVVRRLCSRVVVLDRGRVVEAGPMEGVLDAPESQVTKALVEAVLVPTVAPQQGPDY